MKKNISVACMVATLIVFFAATMFTGCEKETNDFSRDRVSATQHTTVVTDTVWRERVVHDTINHTDTVWRERVVHDTIVDGRWVDSVVTRRKVIVRHQHTTTATTDIYTAATATYQVRCTNRTDSSFTERLYLYYSDSSVDSTRVRNWTASFNWDKIWSRYVTLNGSNPGRGRVAISGGSADFGSGNNVVFSAATVTTNPAGYTNATSCADVLVYVTAVSNGVNVRTVVNHGDASDSTQGFIPWERENDTTRRLVSVDTVYTHLSTTPNGVWSSASSTLTWSCSNRRTITRHYNRAPLTETDLLNFSIGFPYAVSVSGSAVAAMLGSTVTISGGVASFTAGGSTLTVTLTAQPRTCTLNPIPLPCQHQLTTATVVSNGNGGYRVKVDGTLEGTATTGYVPVTATPRHETSRDTNWNGCGSLVSSSLTSVLIQHTLARTGVVTLHYNIAPLTETINISESTMYYTQYMVSGSANPASIGTTASFTGNSVTIGGVTLNLTPGAQAWCTLTYTTATLTSNGLLVSFSYNGGTGTVTIPVPWNNPDPIFSSVLAAAATDSYTHQIFSQASYRHTYVCVVAQIGSDYRFYWAELAPNLVRADFDSVSITAAEANFYVNHLSDGYYPAMVYDHNNHTSLYRGVVTSVELGTGWQQTYRLAPSNSLAYVMGGSSWTMAGDTGRNAVRGVMNSSGQILADGITVQLY